MSCFQLNRALDARPRADRQLAQVERSRRAAKLAQIVDQRAALRAARDMMVDVGPFGRRQRIVDIVVDDDLVRVHGYRNSARSFARALKTCDFEVPSAMPSRLPTSL